MKQRRTPQRIEDLRSETLAQLVIADFNDRRSEINNRTTFQHVLISLNITAAGALGGFALGDGQPNYSLLLLVPPICSALAMLWANHAYTIRQIGEYIKRSVRPFVADEEDDLWRWELEHDIFLGEFGGASRPHLLTNKYARFGFPVFLVFIGPPLTALVVTFNHLVWRGTIESWTAYALAALIPGYAAGLLFNSLREPKKDTKNPAICDDKRNPK